MMRRTVFFSVLALCVWSSAGSGVADEVRLEHMTWVEVRDALQAGKTTVIVPTGGTEQNGPHMVLGKHNFIVAHTAHHVAERLGNALVAPVLAYVPEGDIENRQGHMAYPGTISVPEKVFAGVLQATAESFRAHGFRTIVFLGDSGGNQRAQEAVAARLTEAWKTWIGRSPKVFSAKHYYSGNGGDELLVAAGETPGSIGTHAGIRDTSEMLAVHPEGVDLSLAETGPGEGSTGQPGRASAERGRVLLAAKIEAAVREIRAFQTR
ncbi:MAG: creatininase family protein [Pseudomonadota bacterium]